jgi:hypothetical protein
MEIEGRGREERGSKRGKQERERKGREGEKRESYMCKGREGREGEGGREAGLAESRGELVARSSKGRVALSHEVLYQNL